MTFYFHWVRSARKTQAPLFVRTIHKYNPTANRTVITYFMVWAYSPFEHIVVPHLVMYTVPRNYYST